MEEELNYISLRIEELTQDRDYHENECRKTESKGDREHHNSMIEALNTEIELMENIQNVVTEYALT